MKVKLIFVASLLACSIAFANKSEFCAGFEEGYKIIKGDLVVTPVCPVAPVIPVGSTNFREGIKAGINAAQQETIKK